MARLLKENLVKEFIKQEAPELKVSAGYIDTLDSKFREYIKQSLKRTTGNGRKTAMSQDL